MLKSTTEVIVMCGGMGRRMGRLATKHECKSLIPIEGYVALKYVLWVLKVFEFRKIFLCVDRDELVSKIEAVAHVVGLKSFEIFRDKGLGTMNALYELQGAVSAGRILVLFGHHLISASHVSKILSSRKGSSNIVVSLYKTSSDDLRKITALNENLKCKYLEHGTGKSRLKSDEYYADVPYLVSRQFVNRQASIPVRSFDAIKAWLNAGNKIIGIESDSPHEFHEPRDLTRIKAFAQKLLTEFEGR